MSTALLVSGFDLVQFEVPDGAQVLLPPNSLPPLQDFKESVLRALDEPLAGPPLARRVNASSRICIVLDDPSLPVPPASRDARGEMLEAVLEALVSFGVKTARVTALIANGLSRQWRPAELSEWLGPKSTSQIGVRCHDAEQ
ncbi:MAG: transcriptional regulator, partial [Myxococcaceae bacterium]|nr:transcriptional regulator [Myxococcaceae bacterium]